MLLCAVRDTLFSSHTILVVALLNLHMILMSKKSWCNGDSYNTVDVFVDIIYLDRVSVTVSLFIPQLVIHNSVCTVHVLYCIVLYCTVHKQGPKAPTNALGKGP